VIVIPANLYHRLSHENISNASVFCAIEPAPGVLDRQIVIPVSLYNLLPREEVKKTGFTLRYAEEGDALIPVKRHAFRELICELCAHFYNAGWVTGTGGSISMRYGNRIYMTPSGVQKERIQPDELYMLDIEGSILSVPPQKVAGKFPKLSDCSPLFLHCYRLRNAGAALHSHDQTCVLVTAISPYHNEFRISHQEMIKGIMGYGYHDELVVPIIDNTAHENELADSLERAIIDYPKSFAVLVRDHGIYVWGDTWEQAKR
jgi:methylthioribulose 1-phosphate dehydratase / enolase-phosphatase E1